MPNPAKKNPAAPPTTIEETEDDMADPIDSERLDDLIGAVDEALAVSAAGFPNSPGQVFTILSPRHGIDITRTVGDFQATDVFRIASNTKTFVAASVFRLVEDGVLSLDDSIVDAGVDAALVDLLVADGYVVDELTVERLLTHSAGLPDHSDMDAFFGAILADPSTVWTPASQVAIATEHGDPLFAPGADTSYSDTGYVLLGEVIESVTGEPLATAVRRLLDFDGLGLTSTWWDVVETPPAGVGHEVEQFVTTIARSSLHPSFDLFGGGGLVANTHDLASFYGALGRGEVFADPETWTEMSTLTSPGDAETRAGMFATDAFEPFECFLHGGYWGTRAYVCPDDDLAIAWSWGQAVKDEGWDDAGFRAAIAAAVVEAIR